MSLKYEPSSEPLCNYVKQLFLRRGSVNWVETELDLKPVFTPKVEEYAPHNQKKNVRSPQMMRPNYVKQS